MSDTGDSTPPATPNKPPRVKPAKPRPDFPLYAHNAGYWAKCIRGRVVYFGPWEDPDGALQKYLDQRDELHSGRVLCERARPVTVKDVANAFMNSKQRKLDGGELSPRTMQIYLEVMKATLASLGKRRLAADLRPRDFAKLRTDLGKRWGPVRMVNAITYVRSAFDYAFKTEMLDRPVRFGPEFVKPSAKVLRQHRNSRGPRMFEAGEIRRMLAAAGTQLRAMILLGVNCGFGNNDVGRLPLAALDLGGGWVNFPRPKTGIDRRCPLWPETVEALRQVLAERKEPKDKRDAGLVFVTKYRGPWITEKHSSQIGPQCRELLDGLGINGQRNFYCLRHTFETAGGESRDQVAVDFIMGHSPRAGDMASVYRERISDDRLRAVTDRVRAWLFGSVGEEVRLFDPAQPALPLSG
jgi:integrase